MNPLRVGIIGLGVGVQHMAAYLRHPGCLVTRLCDLSEEKRSWARREYPGVNVVSRAEEVLDSPDVDLVSIASYDDAHFGQVMGALSAGKHLFVEKPLCRTAEELAAVKSAWRRHSGRVKLGCNLVLRAAPLFSWLKERVAAGDFGDLYAFDGDYLYGRLWKITEGWRKDVGGYSVMEGGGIHMVDLMLWLTGQRPARVFCAGSAVATRGTAFRQKDFAASTLEFPSGLVARITANFGCVHPHQHLVRMFGTRQSLLCDDLGPRLHKERDRDPKPAADRLDLAPLPRHKGDLIPAFVSAVLEDADLDSETQSIFDGVSICAASDLALASGAPQEVRYL